MRSTPKPLKKSQAHNFSICPLRRSKREKRLVFANFTPQEIQNTILNRAAACISDTSSDVSQLCSTFSLRSILLSTKCIYR